LLYQSRALLLPLALPLALTAPTPIALVFALISPALVVPQIVPGHACPFLENGISRPTHSAGERQAMVPPEIMDGMGYRKSRSDGDPDFESMQPLA
jgi:hypothetical protein